MDAIFVRRSSRRKNFLNRALREGVACEYFDLINDDRPAIGLGAILSGTVQTFTDKKWRASGTSVSWVNTHGILGVWPPIAFELIRIPNQQFAIWVFRRRAEKPPLIVVSQHGRIDDCIWQYFFQMLPYAVGTTPVQIEYVRALLFRYD